MRVLGISGSARPRDQSNTTLLLDEALKAVQPRATVELVALSDYGPPGSRRAGAFEEVVAKMRAADGILLATPSHFGMPAARLKALLDATWEDARRGAFEGKAGAALAVEAEGGGELACMGLAHFFAQHRMAFLGYVVGRALREKEVLHDMRALRDARGLGARLGDYLESRRG